MADVSAALEAHAGDRRARHLTHVNYRSAAIADLPAITALAHDAARARAVGPVHSAGSVPIGLAEHDVDLAVGCTYKYLCGGPGAPGFLYIRSDLQAEPAIPSRAGSGRPSSSRWARASGRRRASPAG